MPSRTTRFLAFLVIIIVAMEVLTVVAIGGFVYFAPTHGMFFSQVCPGSELTVQAGNDASIKIGNTTIMVLYEPSFDNTTISNLNFRFPFFPINPTQAEMEYGKPILLIVSQSTGSSLQVGTLMDAIKGASCDLGEMNIKIARATPLMVVLVLKPLP